MLNYFGSVLNTFPAANNYNYWKSIKLVHPNKKRQRMRKIRQKRSSLSTAWKIETENCTAKIMWKIYSNIKFTKNALSSSFSNSCEPTRCPLPGFVVGKCIGNSFHYFWKHFLFSIFQNFLKEKFRTWKS